MIAVLYICTGVYDTFWPSFYRSAEQYFCPGTPKKYIVFTDSNSIDERPNIQLMKQDNMGWPLNTLLRYRMFLRARDLLDGCENVVFFNSNVEFLTEVKSKEFFGEDKALVACIHPGAFSKPTESYTYEKRTSSKAYVHSANHYFCGGLMGGRPKPFLDACNELASCIDVDLGNGIMALWHDESHWNAYLNNAFEAHTSELHILDPSYMYPEGWELPFEKKVLVKEKSKYFDAAQFKRQHFRSNTTTLMNRIVKRLVRLLKHR